jgi:O-phospho-L-seryl-tRNASec:L-selenocysteinyl-tRNA synthase
MGLDGYKRILDERQQLTIDFRRKLEEVAIAFDERILNCPRNTISFGITLDNLIAPDFSGINDDSDRIRHAEQSKQITKFGSMLFTRCISGTRIVPRNESKTISSHTFIGYGSSYDTYPHAYMTAACAVGMSEGEMNEFFVRLAKSWKDYRTKMKKESKNKTQQHDMIDGNL